MRAGLPALVLALAAAAAGAEVPARAAAFVALAQANGCTLTEAQGARLLPGAGLTMQDARDAAALLNRGGLFTVDADGLTLRLVPALCAADAEGVALLLAQAAQAPAPGFVPLEDRVSPAEAAAFAAVLRAHGCTLSEAQADALLPARGYVRDQVQDIVAVLIDGGMARIEGAVLRLTEAACTSDQATDAAWLAALRATDLPEAGQPADDAALGAILLTWSIETGCTLDTADPSGAIARAEAILGPATPDLPARMAALVAQPAAIWRADPALPAGRLRLAYCPL